MTTLRIPVDVAKHISSAWQQTGQNDVVVPRACKTEIERCIGRFRDAAALVQQVRAASIEDDRMHDELSRAQTRLSNLVEFVGRTAASIPALADALPKVRSTLDDELLQVLDHAFDRGTRDIVSESQPKPVPSSAATKSDVEVRNLEASGTHQENAGTEVRPAADMEGVDRAAVATLAGGGATVSRAAVTELDAAASDAAVATSGAEAGLPAAQPPREQLLDAWLHSIATDDERLQRLGELLAPTEKLMLAKLASTMGIGVAMPAGSRSLREQILDALVVSLTADDARIEQIGAVLSQNERDMFTQLRVHSSPEPSESELPKPDDFGRAD